MCICLAGAVEGFLAPLISGEMDGDINERLIKSNNINDDGSGGKKKAFVIIFFFLFNRLHFANISHFILNYSEITWCIMVLSSFVFFHREAGKPVILPPSSPSLPYLFIYSFRGFH